MADLLYNDVLERVTSEEFDYVFEFDGIIPESTTVFSHEVTATKEDGSNVTSTMIIETAQSGTTVTVTINTLGAEASYIVKVKAVASDATPKFQFLLINVSQPGVYK